MARPLTERQKAAVLKYWRTNPRCTVYEVHRKTGHCCSQIVKILEEAHENLAERRRAQDEIQERYARRNAKIRQLAARGLSLALIGRKCKPPISRQRVHSIIAGR